MTARRIVWRDLEGHDLHARKQAGRRWVGQLLIEIDMRTWGDAGMPPTALTLGKVRKTREAVKKDGEDALDAWLAEYPLARVSYPVTGVIDEAPRNRPGT